MYTLNLTEDDISAIDWSGNRYGWSKSILDMLGAPQTGPNELEEHEAWEIVEACERDTDGGHDYFPCLSPKSNLASELSRLIQEVI